MVLEEILLAQLRGERAPEPAGGVGFPARKPDHPHAARVALRLVQVPEEPLALLRLTGQEAERDHAVGLAAAHRLGEQEDAVLALARQAAQPHDEQVLHSVGEIVLGKKPPMFDLTLEQVGQVEHGVASGGIEHAFAGRTERGQGFHRDSVQSVRPRRRWQAPGRAGVRRRYHFDSERRRRATGFPATTIRPSR